MSNAPSSLPIQKEVNQSRLKAFLVIAGILFWLSALIYASTAYLLRDIQSKILINLLPGYWPTTDSASFKREFLAFVIVQFTLFLLCILFVIFKRKLTSYNGFIVSIKVILFLLLVSISGTLFFRDGLLRIFLLISSIFFLVAALEYLAINFGLISKLENYLINAINFIRKFNELANWQKYKFAISLLLFVVAVVPGFNAWYPMTLPNDYYEIPNDFKDTISGKANETISFDEVQKFLESERLKLTHPVGYGEMLSAFDGLNGWTAETGRVFYHHSYIFIPAVHWLKYGFDNSVPYLYGHGNTIFSALLMSINGASLSSYFSFYPLTLLIGILAIGALAGYCAKSREIFIIAIFFSLYELYAVGFTAALLAASFNPIRYLGIALQTAAVFYYFRSSSRFRLTSLFVSTLFSLFWNGEFGYFGVISQLLAISIDKRVPSLFSRLVFALGLLLLPLIYKFVSTPSQDILNAIFLGFFQINIPFLSGRQGVFFILSALIVQLLLVLICFKFNKPERLARLSILPGLMLSLVKIIYNPSSPHLAISLAFFIPFLLAYIPKNRNFLEGIIYPKYLKNVLPLILIFSLTLICWNSGKRYEEDSDFIRKYHVMPFQNSAWTLLGETIPMVTRGEQVEDRVLAINRILKKDETLLMLSPLDHLVSFYVNPKNYCGHFELISNVTQKSDFDKISSCVKRNQNVLIVYDQALTAPCPDLKRLGLSNRCPQKLEVKKNVVNILEHLPKLKEVGRDGSLIFYRKESDVSY